MTTPPKFLVCPNPTKGCTVPAPIWPTDPAMDLEIENQVIFYQIMLIVIIREEGENGLFISLIPKVLITMFLIRTLGT